MDKTKQQLLEIAESILGDSIDTASEETENKALHVLLSESVQVINFINIIEDEFEIEFDDEQIDLDFFQSFNNIVRIINEQRNIVA
jgi:acyl carrier protein